MRRVIAGLVLGTVCGGCYLFSDEPKARKQPGSKPASADAGADAGADAAIEPPSPEGEVSDCPEILTGVEIQARSIASSCGPVRVSGQYRVDGGTLEIAAGVELRFEPGAVLEVGRDQSGTITLAGTPEQPVRLVADSDAPTGSWQGVRLHAGAQGSVLRNVEIHRAGSPDHAALWIAAREVAIEGLTVRGAGNLALELVDDAAPALLGADLSGAGVVVRTTPTAAAGLQELTLEPTGYVAIAPGKIDRTIEWPANRYRIEGVVRVEGIPEQPAQLSLAPGADLGFTPEGRIAVGGLGPGTLSASASPLPEPLPLPPPPGYPDPPPVPSPSPSPSPSPFPSPSPSPAPPPVDMLGSAIRLHAASDPRAGSWSGLLVQDGGQLMLRNVEIAHGGARSEGVIVAEGSASLSLEGCRFSDNLVGVDLRGVGLTIEALDENRFLATPAAIRTSPALLGALGPANIYDEAAQIHVERGKVETDATWRAQAARVVVHGDVFVDRGATLTIAAGARLGFDAGVVLGVGYYEQATLIMRGTEEAPIVLEPAPPPADTGLLPGPNAAPARPWGGVVLGAHAHKTRFEHVELRGTSNDAAIELRDTADATLVNVDGAGCAHATVKWDCESTIGNIGVRASEGTPTAMLAPSGCK